MRLNSLHLVNFRQHADTRIAFEDGLTAILGPNGAGKTTILEALAWALYGQSAARGTKDSIRFARAAPRAAVRVELDFDLSGHRYRVVRGLTSAELYLDGAEQPIANSVTAVNDTIQRRLGMTRAEFFNTYFTGQKELSVMAEMGPTERGQFLSRVLGYDTLRAAQELVRERRKVLVAQLAGLQLSMPAPDVVASALGNAAASRKAHEDKLASAALWRSDADARLCVVAPSWQAAQEARAQAQALDVNLRLVEHEEAAQARDVERLDSDLGALAIARDELETLASPVARLVTVTVELRAAETLAREEGRRQTLAETERSLTDDVASLRERREESGRASAFAEDAREALGQVRRELDGAVVELDARRTAWVRDKQEAETKRGALRTQHRELTSQRDGVRKLGAEGACPICTRALGDSLGVVLDALDAQLDVVTVDGRYFAARVEQLAPMPPELQQLDAGRDQLQHEVMALEAQSRQWLGAAQELPRLTIDLATKEQRLAQVTNDLQAIPPGYDAARHEALREEHTRLVPLGDRATRLGTLLEREPRLIVERAALVERGNGLLVRTGQLRAARYTLNFSEEDFVRLREQHDAAGAESRAAEIAVATSLAELQAARAALYIAERAQRDYETTKAAHDALQTDRKHHDELDRAYADLRTELNQQLRPEISELASTFLADLTDQRYTELELDDQYNIIVLEDGVPKPVLSGGEEDVTNLVLRLAISQMIAERAGQSFSLLILDEVFGALDDVRQRNVVDLLRRLRDRFEQVVLISHIESVREGVDQVIALAYDAESGSARVRRPEQDSLTHEVTA